MNQSILTANTTTEDFSDNLSLVQDIALLHLAIFIRT